MRAGIVLLLALAACAPPSVESLCDQIFEQACYPSQNYDDCVADGHALESLAKAGDCTDAYDQYRHCLGDNMCTFQECDGERDTLEACVGPFP